VLRLADTVVQSSVATSDPVSEVTGYGNTDEPSKQSSDEALLQSSSQSHAKRGRATSRLGSAKARRAVGALLRARTLTREH
jgi:hypothetical protein